MIFVDDLAPGLDWLAPAPIGTVEDGWADIVRDLLTDIGAAVAERPGTTVDVLAVSERDGELRFDAVVDGVGADDQMVLSAVATASALARSRAASTCSRCGRAGRLRHRSGWPATRCDDHDAGRR